MKVIGHRGAAGLAPENTFAGFDLALELGVDGIETDVQKTKDGKLVLFHGERLDRTTNGIGVLQEASWQELQHLDAGSWFDDIYAGQRIPLLIEALERYGTRSYLDLEIKQIGLELEVLDMVEQLNLLDRVAFTSRDFPTVCNIKKKNPPAQAGYLTADFSEENLERGWRALFSLCSLGDSLFKWQKPAQSRDEAPQTCCLSSHHQPVLTYIYLNTPQEMPVASRSIEAVDSCERPLVTCFLHGRDC